MIMMLGYIALVKLISLLNIVNLDGDNWMTFPNKNFYISFAASFEK